MAKGKFITLEGGEGTGKSTQAALLAKALQQSGVETLSTREPGGAPGAEEIRGLLVKGDVARWQPLSEALLHYAARHEHLQQTVFPALAAGRWVISDRFADSTMAYQGYGHGLDREVITRLHRLVTGGFAPDLTLVLDIPAEVGLKRALAGDEDRYERMSLEFHERLRAGFLDIAEREPERCAVLDAADGIEQVQKRIQALVRDRLGAPLP